MAPLVFRALPVLRALPVAPLVFRASSGLAAGCAGRWWLFCSWCLWCRWCSGRCRAWLLCVPVGGGSSACGACGAAGVPGAASSLMLAWPLCVLVSGGPLGRAALCARGRRPAGPGCFVCPWAAARWAGLLCVPVGGGPPASLRLGASTRCPARPRHRPRAPQPGPAACHRDLPPRPGPSAQQFRMQFPYIYFKFWIYVVGIATFLDFVESSRNRIACDFAECWPCRPRAL